ncbi:uncharacterized protein LOC131434859 [Malaya genurostris]|uniref:uncharacterized protein LOC131434859 n=1 Tax=Malaya genurostris TaxID=325434 RepID=UPI0026F3FA62|nr:uncharacterized protein LOC131434859 [Malaya genurostris]
MARLFLYVFCLTIHAARGDVFAAKTLTRALVPPKRDSDYRNTQSSTTQLPEVIINRLPPGSTAATQRDTQGYFYDPPNNGYLPPDKPFADEPLPPPQLPPFSNEYPSVDDQYLPPNDDPVFADPPVNDYLPPLPSPPQQDEIIIVTTAPGYFYEPPSSSQSPLADEGFVNPPANENGYHYNVPTNGYLPPVGRSLRDDVPSGVPIRLQLNELTCLPSSGGFFRSTLTVQSSIDSTPIVDVESDGNDLSVCNVRIEQSRLLVNIDASYFAKCGVQRCGSNNVRELCLRLRFPQILGMRTASDAILTLQCKIQQRVVARTHAFRLGISNDVQGRSSSGTFAFGGSQRPFRSQLGLFRKQENGNGFTRALEPGGSVLLGEDLILRTQVKSGDGWNHTRLSEVAMQRLSPTGGVLNTATLVTTKGCLNPTMKAICPTAPVPESPLSYRLAFRAAMFQGMHSGDEMVLRVRVVGCVDRRECSVENCATIRSKRETTDIKGETTETIEHELPSETATISFRIMVPSEATTRRSLSPLSTSVLTLWATVVVSLIILIALIVLMGLIKQYGRKQTPYDEYRSD